jgi:hypothetical protein
VRLILVPTADRPEAAIALKVAFDLASTLGANVSGYHLRRERRETAPSGTDALPDAAYDGLAKANRLTSKAAQAVFTNAAAVHGFELARRAVPGRRKRAYWHEMVGSPERVFAIIGPVADLAVVSRPKARSAGRARAFLLAALLRAGRPVLILPQRSPRSIGRRIVIAWNQSADAAAAVAATMPLLQSAERVVAVTCGAENRTGPKSTHLAQYLANWDVKLEHERTAGDNVEQEIESAYRAAGGDLLLMGGYSRSRFRQLAFGGVTEHMLFKTEMPVVMLHR